MDNNRLLIWRIYYHTHLHKCLTQHLHAVVLRWSSSLTCWEVGTCILHILYQSPNYPLKANPFKRSDELVESAALSCFERKHFNWWHMHLLPNPTRIKVLQWLASASCDGRKWCRSESPNWNDTSWRKDAHIARWLLHVTLHCHIMSLIMYTIHHPSDCPMRPDTLQLHYLVAWPAAPLLMLNLS